MSEQSLITLGNNIHAANSNEPSKDVSSQVTQSEQWLKIPMGSLATLGSKVGHLADKFTVLSGRKI